MGVLSSLKSWIGSKDKTERAPEGFCPNCWGRQEYEGNFYKALKNENIDLNNIDEKKGWIEAYVARHLEGIQLKPGEDVHTCPTCKVTYAPE